ncbi:MAG: ATP-binding protein [Isosphaeraceae bacterium]
MAQLIILQGENIGHRTELLQDSTIVGREAGCTLCLKDVEISRRHLEIRRENGRYRLIDLRSSNGTTVNNQPVNDVLLKRGDRIGLGHTLILFQDDALLHGILDEVDGVRLVSAEAGNDKSAIVHTLSAYIDGPPITGGTKAPHWLQQRLANLDVMYQATREISLITESDDLLPRMLELVFDAIGADRGAILLVNSRGDVQPKTFRCRGPVQQGEQIHVSHSIVDHVLQQKQGVICMDTLADSRFATAPSVVQYGIREAICVPLQGRHSILGVIYADHRSLQMTNDESSVTRRFSQDHLALMVAIGDQAGLALENTNLYQEKLDAERLAAIGQTITIVSHHVKNVLQGLKGGSSLIQSGLDTGDVKLARRGQHILERNLGRVYDLVLDMLSYAKSREPVRQDVHLKYLVYDLVELMRPRAESQGIRMETNDIPETLVCWLDEEGIHRAVLNLVTNAIDALAGHEGGVIRVETIENNKSGHLEITVSDNGPGIADEDMAGLFELFSSTKGSKGTGLGLPVSDKIVREHGGQILVKSEVGSGTSFTVILPILPGPERFHREPGNMEATISDSSVIRK